MSIYWIALSVIILFPSLAWADRTVIYRKSDKAVCGWIDTPQTLETELANCVNSELGGSKDDYDTATVSNWQEGKLPVVSDSGGVSFQDDPKIIKREADFASASKKLTDLGLTQDEVNALR
jgi:hypothetical protein